MLQRYLVNPKQYIYQLNDINEYKIILHITHYTSEPVIQSLPKSRQNLILDNITQEREREVLPFTHEKQMKCVSTLSEACQI